MPLHPLHYKSKDRYLEEILDLESRIRSFESDMKCREDVEGLKKESALLMEGLEALKGRIKEKEVRLSEYLESTDALCFRMEHLDSELARKAKLAADMKAPSALEKAVVTEGAKPEEGPKTVNDGSASWWGDMPWVGSILEGKGELLEGLAGGLDASAILEIREKLRSIEEEAKGIESEGPLDLTHIRGDIEEEYRKRHLGEATMKEKADELLVVLKELEELERVPLQKVIDSWWSELRSIEEELEKGKLTQPELDQNLKVMSKKVEVCAFTVQKLKVA